MYWIVIFIGGGLGSMARYAISLLFDRFYHGVTPWSTFTSNTLSCIILALVFSYLEAKGGDSRLIRAGLLVGFCGGFSTFSTFSFETMQLMKNGNHLVAVGNVIISVGVCLILLYKLTK